MAVAKAGICATLPARTSVLAAANSAGGAYSRAKTVHENLRLSAAMLSRFDLIFIMQARARNRKPFHTIRPREVYQQGKNPLR